MNFFIGLSVYVLLLVFGVYILDAFIRIAYSHEDSVWERPVLAGAVFGVLCIGMAMLLYFDQFIWSMGPVMGHFAFVAPPVLYVPFFIWHAVHFITRMMRATGKVAPSYDRPRAAEARGDWPLAEKLWREEIEHAPADFEPYDRLAKMLFHRNESARAADLMRRALQIPNLPEPNRVSALLMGADYLEADGRTEEAASWLGMLERMGGEGAEAARVKRLVLGQRVLHPLAQRDAERNETLLRADVEAAPRPVHADEPPPPGLV